jgi:site-specific recombinase XerD
MVYVSRAQPTRLALHVEEGTRERRVRLRRLSPHRLRHGFANRFLRESGHDVVALRALMGHSRPDTTKQYTDEVELDEFADALDRAAASRHAQRRQS